MQSENVRYYLWYLNNGGTMHNHGLLIFVEFEKEVSRPEIFAHSTAAHRKWRQVAGTDRFMFVELEELPEGELVLQAIDSEVLGLDRRSDLMIWREYGRLD